MTFQVTITGTVNVDYDDDPTSMYDCGEEDIYEKTLTNPTAEELGACIIELGQITSHISIEVEENTGVEYYTWLSRKVKKMKNKTIEQIKKIMGD